MTASGDACANCGATLEPRDGALACPLCAPKTIQIERRETVGISDYMRVIALRDGKPFAYRESPDGGRMATADVEPDGGVSFSLSGRPPQNEEDSVRACGVLIRAMNQQGGSWSDPVVGTAVDVDGESHDRSNPARRLKMQVVRADIDEKTWRDLAQRGRIDVSDTTVDELAARIGAAIALKAALPAATKSDLTLVLDATRLPALGFDSVIAVARRSFGAMLITVGFEAVWLVGPDPLLVHRLA